MSKLFLIFTLICGLSCSQLKTNTARAINSENKIDPNNFDPVEWHFANTIFANFRYVYTPFFVSNENDLQLFTAGGGTKPGNGIRKLAGNISQTNPISETIVLPTGPDFEHYNYFRAARVAKSGKELWMITEVAGCYTGCDNEAYPKRLVTYHSLDEGKTWTFIDYVKTDGRPYVAQWSAHTGLIWNPAGSPTLDLVNYANNRFITTGENRDIFISNDGVNFKSIPMNHPFPYDRLIFTSIAKTPFGFHMMTCPNWNEQYYTTTVRHLFSKDLINWYPIESSTFLKNPKFYKGVHLSYDENTKRLWAISPCGSTDGCTYIAWSEPKDYLNRINNSKRSDEILIGDYVDYNGNTAMIVDSIKIDNIAKYKIRLWDGTYNSDVLLSMLKFPLKDYKRQGCINSNRDLNCVGDPIYINNNLAIIMGYNDSEMSQVEFAIKYSDGKVSTGITRDLFTLGW